VLVAEESPDRRAAETAWIGRVGAVVREAFRRDVKDVQAPVFRAHVDQLVAVAGELKDLGDAQRVGAPGIGQVAFRPLAGEIDADEARTVPRRPEGPGWLFEQGGEERVVGVALARGGRVAHREAAEHTRVLLELEQAALLRGHPERPTRVLQHRHHARLALREPDREGGKCLRSRVEAVETLRVPHPHVSLVVLVERLHVGRAQRPRPSVRQVARESSRAPVQYPDARRLARDGSNPQPPLGILQQAARRAERQAGGVVRVVAEHDEVRPVVPHEAARRREPHEAVAVLDDGPHEAVGQAVLDRDVAEGPAFERERERRRRCGEQQRDKRRT